MTELFAPSSERAVLSACLNRLTEGVVGHVVRAGGADPVNLFADHRNRAIFSVLSDYVADGKQPTISSVVDAVEAMELSDFPDGVDSYIAMVQMTPPAPSIEALDSVINELIRFKGLRFQVREIEQVLADIQNKNVKAEPVGVAERLMDISQKTESSEGTPTFSNVSEAIFAAETPAWHISSGIKDLDYVLGGEGFESGCVTIVAARPKVGKTVFMNSMIHQVLKEGGVPLVLNYETKDIEFVSKIMAGHINQPDVGWSLIKKCLMRKEGVRYNRNQMGLIEDAKQWALEQNWRVSFDKTMGMPDIHALVSRARAENPENAKIVLLVDYLQLQVFDSMREREQISDLTRFYKRLAGEFDIPVICLSQLNRDASGDKPLVSHLRGSGSIEQDADTILLLDRPGQREVVGGDMKDYILTIDGTTTRMSDGKEFEVFIDGAVNRIADLDSDSARRFGSVRMPSVIGEELISGNE